MLPGALPGPKPWVRGKTRYNVCLTAKKGLRVEQDNSPEAREFFWHRPRDYHRAMWRTLFDAGRARLFFATHEGERLAAMLVYTDEKRNLMPTYLLQWELMR